MEYNEYIAKDNKVLFNIDNFTYGDRILSAKKLNLVEIDLNIAKQLKDNFNNKKEELYKKYENDSNEEIQTLELNEDTEVYEEKTLDNEINNYKNNIINNLLQQGYIINDVEFIIHTTN